VQRNSAKQVMTRHVDLSPDDEKLRRMYRQMWRIRAFEEKVIELYKRDLIKGSAHVYIGQEAIAVGVCEALESTDMITSTHRGHGHCIAKGGELKPMMAELLGKATGYCKGKGGSMHIADMDLGILGANGIVGGGLTIALGAALSARYLENGRIVVCFFGDGAINQGVFHESANLAAIWKLPLIFVCENNIYALSTRVNDAVAISDLSLRATSYGFPGVTVDGDDVLAVHEAAMRAAERARAGDGPTLLVAQTYRWTGHMIGDPEWYRSREEVEAHKKRGPIRRFHDKLLEEGVLTEETAQEIRDLAYAEVEEAVKYALDSPEPDLMELKRDVYA